MDDPFTTWTALEDMENGLSGNGKGDTPRPIEQEKFDKNFEQVFGKKPKHVCRKFVLINNDWRCYYCGEKEEARYE